MKPRMIVTLSSIASLLLVAAGALYSPAAAGILTMIAGGIVAIATAFMAGHAYTTGSGNNSQTQSQIKSAPTLEVKP
jgi:hypothetical protein